MLGGKDIHSRQGKGPETGKIGMLEKRKKSSIAEG